MKLYRLTSDKLEELHGVNLGPREFKNEKTIQIMIEKNLDRIFPGLEFLTSEHTIDDSRPDTIAFNKETNSFVIIEYKNIQNKGVLDQGVSYLQLLRERQDSFFLLYTDLTDNPCKIDEINWDESRVIFISPHFTSHQKRASRSSELRSSIELYEIKQYKDNIISLDKLERQTGKQKMEPRPKPIVEYNDDDYINGKYDENLNPTPETRRLWYQLKGDILISFEKLEFKQRKRYGGFYSADDGSIICTIQALNSKINLYYSTTVDKELLQLSDFVIDAAGKGKWGIGDYQSEIKNEGDIGKAIPLIEKVYRDKVKF